jgi:hypothetical protein
VDSTELVEMLRLSMVEEAGPTKEAAVSKEAREEEEELL